MARLGFSGFSRIGDNARWTVPGMLGGCGYPSGFAVRGFTADYWPCRCRSGSLFSGRFSPRTGAPLARRRPTSVGPMFIRVRATKLIFAVSLVHFQSCIFLARPDSVREREEGVRVVIAILLPPAVCLLPTANRAAGWLLVAALAVSTATGCGWMAQSDNINGVSLYQQGNYQSAINQFTQAVESDPMDADSYYNLGATYHHLGKVSHSTAYLQQAESYYHQCLDRNPDQRDCYRGLAVLLVEEGRGTDAFSLMQRWVEHSPASPEPRIELARLYEEFGDKASAGSNLQEALALQPTNARALAALGKLKEQQGDSAGALAVYQRSLSTNPNQPQVSARIASLQGSGVAPTAPDGTRMVAVPPATPLR